MAKVKIQGHASGTGVLTVTAPNTSTDRTITLPDATGTLIADNGSGKVGIGVTSPAVTLELAGGGGAIRVPTGGELQFGGDANKIYGHASNNYLRFDTNSTERMRVTDNGLTFNGDTAAANALDDYEEGTHNSVWTASSSGTITPYRSHMAYTKIGRVVHMTGEVEISSVSSPTGSTRFTLPFVVATASTQRNMNFGGAGFAAYHINFTENNPPVILAHESESFAKLVYQRNDSSFVDYNPAAGDTFFFSFSYMTTS